MKPLVAIVGRPNVGKSTLFNRLIGERRAIVLNVPGVTRDRHYGQSRWDGHEFDVVDTGGFEPKAKEGVVAAMRRQALLAIEQAAVVIFVMDGQEGLQTADMEVAHLLRCANEKVIFAVNKVDIGQHDNYISDFYALGVEHICAISAEHGRSVNRLLDKVVAMLPPPVPEDESEEFITRIALVGRPNVGKSTLTNRMLGEERMIVDAVAGTTRDAVDSPLFVNDKEYLLIDTAGLRKKKKINRKSSEGYSVLRTLQAISRCHVAILLIDATEGVTDQDAKIAGYTLEKGRALIIAVNKWDAIEKDAKTSREFAETVRHRLPFATYAPILFMSGLTGQRTHRIMGLVDSCRRSHQTRITTGELNRWLRKAVQDHHPAMMGTRQLKLNYATQPRVAPPTVIVHCNDPKLLHFSYRRYLENRFRASFKIEGTPVKMVFRGKYNPYVDGHLGPKDAPDAVEDESE